MNITREQQIERLQELHRVAELHAAVNGDKPVKLNGESRKLDMHLWACETSACLLGSYCLTDMGKQYFRMAIVVGPRYTPRLINGNDMEDPMELAADHFGITYRDSQILFDPSEYEDHECDFTEVDEDEDSEAPILASAVLERTREILNQYQVPWGEANTSNLPKDES